MIFFIVCAGENESVLNRLIPGRMRIMAEPHFATFLTAFITGFIAETFIAAMCYTPLGSSFGAFPAKTKSKILWANTLGSLFPAFIVPYYAIPGLMDFWKGLETEKSLMVQPANPDLWTALG